MSSVELSVSPCTSLSGNSLSACCMWMQTFSLSLFINSGNGSCFTCLHIACRRFREASDSEHEHVNKWSFDRPSVNQSFCKRQYFLLNSRQLHSMSRLVGKLTMWFPNRSDTNQAVQSQKQALEISDLSRRGIVLSE